MRLRQRSPDEIGYLLSRAVSLRALGRDEEAAQLIEAAQARSVLAPALNGQLALAAQELGNAALARRLFIKAIAVDPAALKSAVYLGYARLLVGEGDFTAAKRILRQAYRNPENRDVSTVVEYLKQSGRPVAAELRDLGLPASVAREVEARMGD